MRRLILNSALAITALGSPAALPAMHSAPARVEAETPLARASSRHAPSVATGSNSVATGSDTLPLSSTTSLLVVAPHPDDETLCCAGVIQRVLHLGGRVAVVWITSGDASELDRLLIEKRVFGSPERMRDLGARRMQEARDATTLLGVASASQYFLGYPDRGILALVTDNYVTPYRSGFTDSMRVPYPGALFPGHPYTGRSLEGDLTAVLDRVHATLVLAPSPRDAHPDHRATGIATIRILSLRNELNRARYWIVHGGEGWPAPKGLQQSLAMTVAPLAAGLSPAPFTLKSEEESRKLLAVRSYHTQMTLTSANLFAFVRTTELFSSAPVPEGAPSR